MPRPRKCRRVCRYPHSLSFIPENDGKCSDAVVLTLDEYETIRLIDSEGLSQEQCSRSMNVARTTVQQIYASARKKLADAIVYGLPIKIAGGDFQLCDGQNKHCGNDRCYKEKYTAEAKGENTMRIAVTYENGMIFQHFGHTQQFKLYDVQDGKVTACRVIDTNGQGHGALAGILAAVGADVLICGGIGGGAKTALANAGVKLYGGVSGDADKAVAAFIAGTLNFNANVQCNHHGEHHHGEGHNCGEHSCGEHKCH